jgi:Xaa-Pro aminopeptidase
LKQLQTALKKQKLDACLIEQPLELFYFTGLKLSAGRLLVHSKQTQLLVDGRYVQAAEERSPYKVALDSPEKFTEFCRSHRIQRLGFDGRHTSYDHFLRLQKQGGTEIKLIASTPLFKTVRSVKDNDEIQKLKKSAAVLWKGFQFIRASLKKGVKEIELSKRFEIFCLERGADRLSFEPIIAFGPNSAMPHYRSQNTPLKEGDIVLIDIGVCVDNYHSDMTRVLFFKKENPYLRRLYEIVRRAQKSSLKLCGPGAKIKEIDTAARQVMREEQVEDLFVHSLGHGIGLEVHEFPRLKFDGEDKDVELESGMVFTIEPGLYVPGIGGVRYEDTIVITPTGHKNFYPLES